MSIPLLPCRLPAIAATAMLLAAPAAGDPAGRGAELRQVVYRYGVAEYCGLNSFAVYDGYQREMRAIVARDGLSEEEARRQRIHGMTDADLEYGNRGLGGFRNWCRTEGADAARHFTAFRDAALAADPGSRGDRQSP